MSIHSVVENGEVGLSGDNPIFCPSEDTGFLERSLDAINKDTGKDATLKLAG